MSSTMLAFPPLTRRELDTLQVNLGYRCNQACAHCHVDAGPNRTEAMDAQTIDLVVRFVCERNVRTLDITGGAPELNQHFRQLVTRAAELGVEIIDRCNLTVLEQPGQADLTDFLAAYRVHVIASLPCYTAANVDRQRGKGVFESSIRGIRALNRRGYGKLDTGLVLDFVYNPVGPYLPPDSLPLEASYRKELAVYGVEFNSLLALTNMPISRFRHALERDGQLQAYMRVLKRAYVADNLDHVMCRSLLSVDWRGYVFDCDFNQMLGIHAGGATPLHLSECMNEELAGAEIAVGEHCFGCTAGKGSSCTGALRA